LVPINYIHYTPPNCIAFSLNLKQFFASYIYDKGLITRIYRQLKTLNSPKINEPMKKWANELSRGFSKEEFQMAKKYMKKCLPSLATKEM
jgi:hypothetical protein